MAELTTEQLVYLLYAKAYTEAAEAETVTNGTVKVCLPSQWKEKAEKIYDALKTQKLIELRTKEGKPTNKKGRFSITEQGNSSLVANLATTDYKFTSSKGYRVLNTLLACIKEAAETHPQIKSSDEMSFDEFREKFKAIYFEERRQQEIRGVVAIYSQEICQKFIKRYPISSEKLEQYFDLLKVNGEILAVIEKNTELIQWVE